MWLAGGVNICAVSHSVRSKSARRELGKVPNGRATLAFAAYGKWSGCARTGCSRTHFKCAGLKKSIYAVPVLVQERGGSRPRARLQFCLRLRSENVGILPGRAFVV